jgi:putative transposase
MKIVNRTRYATDLTDAQWELISPFMPKPCGAGKPLEVNFREIVNAILYRLRTGCPWELLPHDFPPKSTVFEYYRKWQFNGTLQSIHDAMRASVRLKAGKAAEATVALLDSQSAKTTENCQEAGYDAGKKINGRKRHLLVDTLGLVIVAVVTLASVQDRDGAKLTLAASGESTVKTVFADTAYSGKLIDWSKRNYDVDLKIVKRPQGKFEVVSMRWIAERTFGWLNRYRLLSKEYETTMESSTADIHIAMMNIMVRRLTRPPKRTYANEHLLAHLT